MHKYVYMIKCKQTCSTSWYAAYDAVVSDVRISLYK